MRSVLALLVVTSPLLAACQQAHAMTNDEMAHCAAAIGYEHEVVLRQSPPRYDLLPSLTAGLMWYRQKLTVAGVPDAGRAEIVAFVSKNSNNPKLMLQTFQQCGANLLRDPEFKKQEGPLLVAAAQADPVCKNDPSICLRR
jgi:hypothetical protein